MKGTVLLTGATGFVGRAVAPALVGAGWKVRALTRDLSRARRDQDELEWVEGDVNDAASMARALEGCDTALYLVHGMGDSPDYKAKETAAAAIFSECAAAARVNRVVYLGGVAPKEQSVASAHLRSRTHVGEILRAGSVPTVELRASMIVGFGSLSWLIVRDLAARLPIMVLPRWLKSRTEPVAIDDVVVALVRALEMPVDGSAVFDVPGPQVLSGKDILQSTAKVIGLAPPAMIEVPLLSPRLSSFWVRFVTRARWSVAREVVVGLADDLLAVDDSFWKKIGHEKRQRFDEAARSALAAEKRSERIAGFWGVIERMRSPRNELAAIRPAWLAVGSVVLWALATALARRVGIWWSVGPVALVLASCGLVANRSSLQELFAPTRRSLVWGCVTGGVMAALTYLLYPPATRLLPAIAHDTTQLYAVFRSSSLVAASIAIAPIVIAEEIVWRNIVQDTLVDRVGPHWGVAVAAAIYALSLAPLGSPLLVLVAFLCGLTWGTLRALTGSLLAPILAHLFWDLLVLVCLPLDGA
jgi:uncharacterized protein YbjT (DUF2867 family)/membrane protease YdiL (CAAX protease family)